MNILEIIWIISTIYGIIYFLKMHVEYEDLALMMLPYIILSLIFLIPYIIIKYFDFLTTPLW